MANIVLISLLKPCDDVRMYHKIAKSLADSEPQNTFFLVGFKTFFKENTSKNIIFIPIFSFKRLSINRVFANFYLLKQLFRIKPKRIVVCTFELLPACLIYKLLSKVKIIYDIQENYVANILYTPTFAWYIRYFIAFLVYLIEYFSSFFIDYYFLAEQCYIQELRHLHKNQYVLLENKALFSEIAKYQQVTENQVDNFLKLALVGTLSNNYGVFEALHWVEEAYKDYPDIRLYLCGSCLIPLELAQIQTWLQSKPFVSGSVSPNPIDYSLILQTMQQADVVLMPYKLHKNIIKRIPTKMYECLVMNKKMLIQSNIYWQNFLSKYPCFSATFTDFEQKKGIFRIITELQKNTYSQLDSNYLQQFCWEFEAKKMVDFWKKNNIK